MSICCGYLFFQRDTVYFLRLYFNPKWLEISPLEWPTQTENTTMTESVCLAGEQNQIEGAADPLSLTVGFGHYLPLERSKSSSRV